MKANRSDSRCKGKTTKGKPCRAAAMEGGLCFFHANPAKAAELGRLGGMRNRHTFVGSEEAMIDLKTARGVLEECARLIENVYAGKIPPKVATCIGTLLNLQMRVIHGADVEARIAQLEQARAHRDEHSNDADETSIVRGERPT